MRIDRVRLVCVPLRMVSPLSTSQGDHASRTAVLVEITTDDGTVGWGENVAPEGDFYTGETHAISVAHMREVVVPALVDDDPGDDWDEDYTHERTLLHPVVRPDPKFVKWINPDIRRGEQRDVAVMVGEGGGIFTLDRRTGQFLWANPFPFDAPNFLISDIDGKTGRVTMVYMGASLAITVAGLLVAYLLFHVEPVEGKTLNAVLFGKLTASWPPAFGSGFVWVTLASEAVLLFIAAQAGWQTMEPGAVIVPVPVLISVPPSATPVVPPLIAPLLVSRPKLSERPVVAPSILPLLTAVFEYPSVRPVPPVDRMMPLLSILP